MENEIINHSADIPMEEKVRIFDLACEKYIEGREVKAGAWINKGWSSPQEYMGYAVYKALIDTGAIELIYPMQQKFA